MIASMEKNTLDRTILSAENEPEIIEFNRLCFPTDYWKVEDWHELLNDPRAVYYAVTDEGRIVGNVFIYNWQGELDYVKIMNLSVHPGYRGRGLARRLLAHVTEVYGGLGMRRFCAETRATNYAMQRVFDVCGYRLGRVEKDGFENPKEDEYKYVLEI